jgi:hypothetical protein
MVDLLTVGRPPSRDGRALVALESPVAAPPASRSVALTSRARFLHSSQESRKGSGDLMEQGNATAEDLFPPESPTENDCVAASRPPTPSLAPEGPSRPPMRSNTYSIIAPREAAPLSARGRAAAPPCPSPAIGACSPVPAAPESESDLDEARRVFFDVTLASYRRMTHYGVLGVLPTSGEKEIRLAFYARISQFHPDRYFEKNIGAYRATLNEIARFILEAYEVLTREKSRAAYDASLRQSEESALP